MRVFKDNLSTFSHWFAWTMSVIASIFFGIYMIGEDIPNYISGSDPTLLWFILALLVAITGTALSVWNRINGGLTMLAGGVGLVFYFYFTAGWSDSGLMVAYGLPYILPAFLLLMVKKSF
jgi:hypothetical protein